MPASETITFDGSTATITDTTWQGVPAVIIEIVEDDFHASFTWLSERGANFCSLLDAVEKEIPGTADAWTKRRMMWMGELVRRQLAAA